MGLLESSSMDGKYKYIAQKGYIPCEYIQSSGTQYIDTGFKPNQDTRVLVDIQLTDNSATCFIFGGRDTETRNNIGCFYQKSTGLLGVDYSSSSNRKLFNDISPLDRLSIDFNKNTCTINDVSVTSTATSYQSSYSMTLLAINIAGTVGSFSKARLYSCQIFDNGILVRDFVPSKSPSGVYGLYDIVTDVFYPSEAGVFTGLERWSAAFYKRSFRRSLILADDDTSINCDDYMTIVALEDGLYASLSTSSVEYCVDGDGNWITLAANTNTRAINTGQTLSFRGKLTPTTSSGIGVFTISKPCNLTGNCNSLLFKDDVASNLTISRSYAFYQLFSYCPIKAVSPNFLPATTLSEFCYNRMFCDCTTLITAPNLPSHSIAYASYNSMFTRCSSLVNAPEISATEVSGLGCSYMFKGCTSLTKAPTLLSEGLSSYCYNHMFQGCSKLKHIKALFITKPNDCTKEWVDGVASSGTFVMSTSAEWYELGINGIPSGWTVQKV